MDLPIVESLAMYGLAIVIAFATAVVIRGIVLVTGRVGSAEASADAPASAPVARPVAGVPPEHIAAIAAAAYAVLGAHRIVHIDDVGRGQAWTAEGRMMHQTSHRPH